MVTVLCTRPSATKIASAVRLQPCLQRSAESIAHNPTAAKCVEGHGDVRFVLAGLAWCRRQTSNPRAAEHALAHSYITHHMAWTACSPHVLAGRSKAVELAYNGYQWLYKSWAVAFDGSACRGAMASIALPHVSTENDRQINLSQRVLSTRCERSTFASL